MTRQCDFRFDVLDLADLERQGYVFCLSGAEVTDETDVFSLFGAGLSAPNGYFGKNWDAFQDCLLDLDWIKSRNVFIIHKEIPNLSPEDQVIYLQILQYAVETWGSQKTEELERQFPEFTPHRLAVFFPKNLESEILHLLAQSDDD